MNKITKTISQLHFEDLEPHRFEDLVRQLAYDFKDWSDLEDTGKLGSDEGFDIRGREPIQIEEEESETENESKKTERIWLFQCKREKQIRPSKLKTYMSEIVKKHKKGLYGLVFVASCHFSKKARDEFYQTLKDSDVQEAYLWDRSRLEDMLFQPKNDHLLFAYFGISISIRRRSLKTQIRNRLVPKRKLIRIFGDVLGKFYNGRVLIRDAEDKDYPYASNIRDFESFPRWKLFKFKGYAHNGIILLTKEFYAYLDDDKIHWDYVVDKMNTRILHHDPWGKEKSEKERELDHRIWSFWSKIPQKNQSWLRVTGIIPFEKIIEVDEHGDSIASDHEITPHIYVQFENKKIPFEYDFHAEIETLETFGRRLLYPKEKNRIKYFPRKFPKPKQKGNQELLKK